MIYKNLTSPIDNTTNCYNAASRFANGLNSYVAFILNINLSLPNQYVIQQ